MSWICSSQVRACDYSLKEKLNLCDSPYLSLCLGTLGIFRDSQVEQMVENPAALCDLPHAL